MALTLTVSLITLKKKTLSPNGLLCLQMATRLAVGEMQTTATRCGSFMVTRIPSHHLVRLHCMMDLSNLTRIGIITKLHSLWVDGNNNLLNKHLHKLL